MATLDSEMGETEGLTYPDLRSANSAIKDFAASGIGARKDQQPDGTWKVTKTGFITTRQAEKILQTDKQLGRQYAKILVEKELGEEGVQYTDPTKAQHVAEVLDAKGYKTEIHKQPDGIYRLTVKDKYTNEFVYIQPKEVKRFVDDYDKLDQTEKASEGIMYKSRDNVYDVSKALEDNGYKTSVIKQSDGSYKLTVLDKYSRKPVYMNEKDIKGITDEYYHVKETAKAETGTNLGLTNRHQVQSIKSAYEAKGYEVRGTLNKNGTYNLTFYNRNTGMAESFSQADINKTLKEAGANLKIAPKAAARQLGKKTLQGLGKSVRSGLNELGASGKQMLKSDINNTFNTMAVRQGERTPAKRMVSSGFGGVSKGERHPMIAEGFGADGKQKKPRIQAGFKPDELMGKNIDVSGLYRLKRKMEEGVSNEA